MEAVMFIGIQGSGKSTFYRQRFFDTHVRLNLDMLKTRHRLWLLTQACLNARQRFVLDNTNVLRKERATYIEPVRRAGFRVVGYYFEPDVERALEWNAQRSGKRAVPVKGVLGTLKRLQRPGMQEGFDELYRVRVDPDGEFVMEHWEED